MKMAGSPDGIAISIKIFERSWTLNLERGPDRLGKSIVEWNRTSERRYVETKSELNNRAVRQAMEARMLQSAEMESVTVRCVAME